MEIAKEKKRIYDHRFNGFHQIITSSEEVEYTTYTGTMEEQAIISKIHIDFIESRWDICEAERTPAITVEHLKLQPEERRIL